MTVTSATTVEMSEDRESSSVAVLLPSGSLERGSRPLQESAEEVLEEAIRFHQSSTQLQRQSSRGSELLYPSTDELVVESAQPDTPQNFSLHETTATATPSDTVTAETCSDEPDTVIIDTVVDEEEQPATVVSVERLETEVVPATATVVETVEDGCRDDALIRKLLQQDLIESGRSTVELHEYIQQASLQDVSSIMETSEEEKTEVATPPAAAAAWATTHASEHEQPISATADEQATVVGITEHDIHPSDLSNADARAEFIGQDYSIGVAVAAAAAPDVSEGPAPDAAAAAEAVASLNVEDSNEATVLAAAPEAITSASREDATEATVLDSKPAARPAMWSDESTEEATVLETRSHVRSSWVRAEREEEVTVDAVAEEEATVVAITEDVHPADFERNEAQATLIGRDFTRAVTYSSPSPPGPQPLAAPARAMSDPHPNRNTNPFQGGTPRRGGLFDEGLAALDAMEEHNWMNCPAPIEMDDHVILPPPMTGPAVAVMETGNQEHESAPMATAEALDVPPVAQAAPAQVNEQEEGEVPPLPSTQCQAGRETSRASQSSRNPSEESYIIDFNDAANTRPAMQRGSSLQMFSTAAARGTHTVVRNTNLMMDRLFGETRHAQHPVDLDAAAKNILPRTLLPWSVFPNESIGMWVATVNTNQKALDSNNVREASKALRAFSVKNQRQAEALAIAWAPPRMLPFADNPVCFICESRFAIFKRACHCRNCGVCVCVNCVVQWPAKMLPETYNIKKESTVNVCKSCDWLCSAFRLALLSGQHDQSVAIHATGNVNLTTPFANVKGELFYPVHCAVLGGSLSLLKWLVDDHCCPLRSIRVSGVGRRRDSRGSFTPILTSKGRSLLGIAMEIENIDITRYLVADKNMHLSEEKHLTMDRAIRILEAVLRKLPSESETSAFESVDINDFIPTEIHEKPSCATAAARPAAHASPSRDDASTGSVEDACILCYANSIDCVATPCGHQICCMQCSTNISRCPVCSDDCTFIRVYKP